MSYNLGATLKGRPSLAREEPTDFGMYINHLKDLVNTFFLAKQAGTHMQPQDVANRSWGSKNARPASAAHSVKLHTNFSYIVRPWPSPPVSKPFVHTSPGISVSVPHMGPGFACFGNSQVKMSASCQCEPSTHGRLLLRLRHFLGLDGFDLDS